MIVPFFGWEVTCILIKSSKASKNAIEPRGAGVSQWIIVCPVAKVAPSMTTPSPLMPVSSLRRHTVNVLMPSGALLLGFLGFRSSGSVWWGVLVVSLSATMRFRMVQYLQSCQSPLRSPFQGGLFQILTRQDTPPPQ